MVLTKEVWEENYNELVEHIKNACSDIFNVRQRPRNKVKLRVLTNNGGIPVYGVSVPRHIAASFLQFDNMNIEKSGLAIVLTAVEIKDDNNENDKDY